MKLGALIIISFSLLFLLGSAAETYILYGEGTELLAENTQNRLDGLNSAKAEHIETYLSRFHETTRLIVDRLTTFGPEERTIHDIRGLVEAQEDILRLDVATEEGVISIIPTREERKIDTTTAARNIRYSNETDTFVFSVNREVEGMTITMDVSTTKLFSITQGRAGLDETGESYFIDKDGTILSPSRFREDVIGKTRVEDVVIDACYNDTTPPLTYPDYRGVQVAGSHEVISPTGWCLVTEIDREESLGLEKRLVLQRLLFVITPIILATILVGYIVTTIILRPLRRMEESIEDITKGDLDVDLKGKTSIDEIEDLRQSLKRILSTMKLAIKRSKK